MISNDLFYHQLRPCSLQTELGITLTQWLIKNCNKSVTEKSFLYPVWNDYLATEEEKESFLNTIYCNKVMSSRVISNIPKVCNSSKRSRRKIFLSHVLRRLVSRYQGVPTDNIKVRNSDAATANTKI